jgi:basic amino acid/polyamine antiporter, APA family
MLRGVKDSIMFNNIISVLNCVNIVLILIAGMFFMDTNRFTPFVKGGHISSVLQSFGLAYFATIGFDAAACYTKEARNPKKDIPLAIITSLIFSGMIYILIAVVSIGMAPIDILGNNQGLVMAFAYNNQSGLAKIISIGSLIGLTTTTFVSLLGQPRVFFSMSEDGLLHSKFAEVNSANQVPVFSTYVTGITAISVALFFDIEILANVISLACLMCYGLVCLGTVEMRYEQSSFPFFRRLSFGLFILLSILLGFATKSNWATWISVLLIVGLLMITGFIGSLKQTNVPDKFVCPMVPYVPLVGVFSNFYIFGTITLFPYILFVMFMAMGCLIYFNYSIKHSKLNRVKRIMNTKEREITLQLFK